MWAENEAAQADCQAKFSAQSESDKTLQRRCKDTLRAVTALPDGSSVRIAAPFLPSISPSVASDKASPLALSPHVSDVAGGKQQAMMANPAVRRILSTALKGSRSPSTGSPLLTQQNASAAMLGGGAPDPSLTPTTAPSMVRGSNLGSRDGSPAEPLKGHTFKGVTPNQYCHKNEATPEGQPATGLDDVYHITPEGNVQTGLDDLSTPEIATTNFLENGGWLTVNHEKFNEKMMNQDSGNCAAQLQLEELDRVYNSLGERYATMAANNDGLEKEVVNLKEENAELKALLEVYEAREMMRQQDWQGMQGRHTFSPSSGRRTPLSIPAGISIEEHKLSKRPLREGVSPSSSMSASPALRRKDGGSIPPPEAITSAASPRQGGLFGDHKGGSASETAKYERYNRGRAMPGGIWEHRDQSIRESISPIFDGKRGNSMSRTPTMTTTTTPPSLSVFSRSHSESNSPLSDVRRESDRAAQMRSSSQTRSSRSSGRSLSPEVRATLS